MNIGLLHALKYPDSDAVIFLNAGDFFFSKESLCLLETGLAYKSQVSGLSAFLETDDGFEVSVPKIDLSSMSSPVHLWIPHQAFCATIGTYRSIGLMDIRYRIAGDIDWFVRSAAIHGNPHFLNEVISVQMVGGRSRVNAYSGYLERIEIAKAHALRVENYPKSLLLRVYLSQKLGRRVPKLFRKKMPRTLEFEVPTIERFLKLSLPAATKDQVIQPED